MWPQNVSAFLLTVTDLDHAEILRTIEEAIRRIRVERQVAIVVAEQNATQALGVADRVMVLSLGQKSAVMEASELTTEQLKHAYQI